MCSKAALMHLCVRVTMVFFSFDGEHIFWTMVHVYARYIEHFTYKSMIWMVGIVIVFMMVCFTSLPHTRKHHSHGWFYTLFLSFLSRTWCFALDLYVSPAIAYFLYIVRYKYIYQFNVTHNITRSWSHRCFFFSFSLVFITAVRYGHANSRSE